MVEILDETLGFIQMLLCSGTLLCVCTPKKHLAIFIYPSAVFIYEAGQMIYCKKVLYFFS